MDGFGTLGSVLEFDFAAQELEKWVVMIQDWKAGQCLRDFIIWEIGLSSWLMYPDLLSEFFSELFGEVVVFVQRREFGCGWCVGCRGVGFRCVGCRGLSWGLGVGHGWVPLAGMAGWVWYVLLCW